jgi:EXLDI family protein
VTQMHRGRAGLTCHGLYVYSYAPTHPTLGRYDAAVPNKTIYVSDGDLNLFQRAQELAGGNLSSAIATALRRYVDTQEGLKEGFDDVVVRVGVGSGRKVRFTGVLVGEWLDSRTKRAEHYRVWRGRRGKYVLHIERQPDYWMVDAEGKDAGWRGHLGIGDVRYGSVPKESTIEVVATVDDLLLLVPPELFDMVSRAARQPTVEELDI